VRTLKRKGVERGAFDLLKYKFWMPSNESPEVGWTMLRVFGNQFDLLPDEVLLVLVDELRIPVYDFHYFRSLDIVFFL
jgi:hypothetical protein